MPDGFSYSILDTKRFEYKILESYSFGYELDQYNAIMAAECIIRDNSILEEEFERVSVSLVSQNFTLVPDDIYIDQHKNSYLKFNKDFETKEYDVFADKLNNLKAHSIYPVHSNLVKMLSQFYPEFRIRHYTSPLIESLLYNISVGTNKSDVVINVYNGYFDIVIIDNNQLRLVNTFKYVTYDDLMFFVFFVLEKMELQSDNLNLLILGNVSMESTLYKSIRLYFKSVDFGSRNDLYRYAYEFDEIPHHYFYTLLNLNSCG
jgi:sulfur relay (sulfurtransferase) DsrC/TusE family protein